MKVVSTDALTKLIQLVKSAFVKVEDVTETEEITLATVATSGSYNDLSNKPTIPSTHFNLLEFKWCDHLLNDVCWLRADTFSWQDGTVYSSAYNELLSEYDAAINAEYKYNINAIGNLTNNTGVLSGFSTSNYAKFPNNFQPGSNPWEMVFKIKTGDATTDSQYIVALGKGLTSETRYATRIYLQEGHFRISVSYNGTAWDIPGESAIGSYTVLSNTDYFVKFQYTGSAYILSYSLDGETYIEDINKTSSTPMYNANTACLIGIWNNGSYTSPWLGSIDLKESYININGQRWWTGAEVFYKVSPKGYKIAPAAQEQNILNAYNDTGIAWYYILDTENIRFKLPRTKWGFKGLRTNVGDKIDESLPNITGNFNPMAEGSTTTDGSFYVIDSTQSGWGTSTGLDSDNCLVGFNASRSSSTYQDDAPVQERATQMYLYFYVGDYSQTAVEQTAGLNSELFNNKLDLNASNLSAQGMSYMASMGMPSNKYINLTLNASGSTYTAPANGWFVLDKVGGTDDTYAFFQNVRNGMIIGDVCNSSWQTMQMYIPVKKGDVIYLQYNITGNTNAFRFIYAVGSESEAS